MEELKQLHDTLSLFGLVACIIVMPIMIIRLLLAKRQDKSIPNSRPKPKSRPKKLINTTRRLRHKMTDQKEIAEDFYKGFNSYAFTVINKICNKNCIDSLTYWNQVKAYINILILADIEKQKDINIKLAKSVLKV